MWNKFEHQILLQGEICRTLQEVDGKENFIVDRWHREEVSLYSGLRSLLPGIGFYCINQVLNYIFREAGAYRV